MTTAEAIKVLSEQRPNHPQKVETKQLQQAIDVAIHDLEMYAGFLKMLVDETKVEPQYELVVRKKKGHK